MLDDSKHSDNNFDAEPVAPPRRGRPKGLPKPPGSGRAKGTPNRVGKEARELAGKYAPKAFRKLGALLDNADPKVVAIAAEQLLNRAYGKPVSPQEITGANGERLIEPLSDSDRARKIMFLLAKAASETLPSGERLPRTVDGLTAVINGEPRAPQVIEHSGPKPDPFAAHREAQAIEHAEASSRLYAERDRAIKEARDAPWRLGDSEPRSAVKLRRD